MADMISVFDSTTHSRESVVQLSEEEWTSMKNTIHTLKKENKLLKVQLSKYLREQADIATPSKPCRLVWVPHDNRFIFFCCYEDRDIPKLSGFMWDRDQKQWYTTQTGLASLLSAYADKPTMEVLGL